MNNASTAPRRRPSARISARWSINTLLLLLSLLLGACLLLCPNWFLAPATRPLIGCAIVLLWITFTCITWRKHRRAQQATADAMQGEAGATIIAYASQTGQAARYAEQTAATLHEAGIAARATRLMPLSHLDHATLATTPRILFVVSTTGEGDAPDNASTFVRNVMSATPSLAHLEYGMLALGDRSYQDYCGFAQALDRWLRHQHAKPLFDLVDVDNGDAGALRHWQHQLSVLTGHTATQDWSAPQYGRWQLVARALLNPGSPGAPAFHIVLRPLDKSVDWHAGDIAEIGPRNAPHAVSATLSALGMDGETPIRIDEHMVPLADHLARCHLPSANDHAALRTLSPQALADQLVPLPHREYSIASLPADHQLELLVRRMAYPDGTPGLGSGWLTQHAALGAEIALRIRTNRSFHTPPDDRPLILIGNGTGLAGLRAHLKARVAAGHHRNWLLFGERTAAHDQFFADELRAWQAQGVLQRLDLAFSRDAHAAGGPKYVQDCVSAAAETLRNWVHDGAAIYVCGSLQGMAQGVAQVLEDVLGASTMERLSDTGRYRRDVY